MDLVLLAHLNSMDWVPVVPECQILLLTVVLLLVIIVVSHHPADLAHQVLLSHLVLVLTGRVVPMVHLTVALRDLMDPITNSWALVHLDLITLVRMVLDPGLVHLLTAQWDHMVPCTGHHHTLWTGVPCQ